MGYSRANLYGKHFNSYKEEAQSPLVIAQIEHIDAIGNLDTILEVVGLDATIIGPYDISASMGLTGELNHPKIEQAYRKILDLSRKMGVPSGMHVVEANEKKLRETVESGYGFIAYSIDAVFLRNMARNIF